MIAGPYGHWYTLLGGELVAHPMYADGSMPTVPLLDMDGNEVDADGWYAPDDLQGAEREAVLSRLAR